MKSDFIIKKLQRLPAGKRAMVKSVTMDMSLQEIREFVRLSELGDESIEDRRALVHGRREKILEQIEDLNRTLRFIEYKCWFYDTASAAGTCEVPRKMPKEEMPPELLATLEECQIQGH